MSRPVRCRGEDTPRPASMPEGEKAEDAGQDTSAKVAAAAAASMASTDLGCLPIVGCWLFRPDLSSTGENEPNVDTTTSL